MPKAFEISDVSLTYRGQQMFSSVSLEAEPGEIIAVCGTEGSHKEYLVNLLTNTYSSAHKLHGSVFVDGADILRLSEEDIRYVRMMNIAVLSRPETVASLRMSVQKYTTLPFRKSVKKSKPEIVADTRRMIELLGTSNTDGIFKKRMSSLSPRDRMAVLYGAALATDPALAIVFADTNAMTEEEADALYALLIKVCKIKSIALLILTDDIEFARRHAERVYIARKDAIFPDDDAHPYAEALLSMRESRALSLPLCGGEELLCAQNAVFGRKNGPESFILHDKEILVLPAQNALSMLRGARSPLRGKLSLHGTPISKSRAYKKGVMPISADMPLPPLDTADDIVRAYTKRPSQRAKTAHHYAFLGLPSDYGQMQLPLSGLYETLRLGLVCAAMAEAAVILLKDIDRLSSPVERYSILSLLVAVCVKTGAGAIVLSDCEDVLEALGKTKTHEKEAALFVGMEL